MQALLESRHCIKSTRLNTVDHPAIRAHGGAVKRGSPVLHSTPTRSRLHTPTPSPSSPSRL